MTKLYFAAAEYKQKLFKQYEIKNILISYFSKPKIYEYKGFNIFLDSGAYSAFTQKKEIDLNEYIKFIKKNEKRLTVYASLDVIGDAEKTYSNFKIMKEARLNPIPTFHIGSDFKWLEKYKNEPYIALGGMVPYTARPSLLKKWLKKCFNIIPKTTKVHAFGMTNPTIVRLFPFNSLDSTSWLTYSVWGNWIKYEKHKFIKIDKKIANNPKTNKLLQKWNLVQYIKFAKHLEERKWNT